MHIYGKPVAERLYHGRTYNPGKSHPDTVSDQVALKVEEDGDTVILSDVDDVPNLRVQVRAGVELRPTQLQVINAQPSSEEIPHVVLASFDLPFMTAVDAAQIQGLDLASGMTADTVSVRELTRGIYQVEIQNSERPDEARSFELSHHPFLPLPELA